MLYYITIATKPHAVLEKIKEKIVKNKEKIIVLGENENRYIGWNAYGNFGIKLKEVKLYLKNEYLNEDDIILFTDAYDVIYYGNIEEIKEKYKKMNSPIIFGCEKECNPNPNLSNYYGNKDKEFPYLNSGLFIGNVKALRECLKEYSYNDKDDDQLFWTYMYLNNESIIKLDYENEIFLNTHNINENELIKINERITYKNKVPCFVHVNGYDKSLLNKLLI